jgi:hypothetical protein
MDKQLKAAIDRLVTGRDFDGSLARAREAACYLWRAVDRIAGNVVAGPELTAHYEAAQSIRRVTSQTEMDARLLDTCRLAHEAEIHPDAETGRRLGRAFLGLHDRLMTTDAPLPSRWTRERQA